MKKLMILAAVMCAAVTIQAAQVNWSVAGSGSGQRNKAVYVFNSSDRETIIKLLTDGTTNGKAAEILASTSWNPVVSGKQTSSSTTTPGVEDILNLGDVATSEIKYFAVVFRTTAEQVGTATQYWISADATGHSYTPSTQTEGVPVKMSIAGLTAQTIPTSAIPEPTSGLLLLLGVAGLALKRKHA